MLCHPRHLASAPLPKEPDESALIPALIEKNEKKGGGNKFMLLSVGEV
jgi:hypothetical protein